MKVNKRSASLLSSVALFHLGSLLAVLPSAKAQDVEIIAAELGGVSMVSIPQPPPLPGLLATKVVLRTAPENTLVTFDHARITGAVHQVWIPNQMGRPTRTPWSSVPGWDSLPGEWIAADSHFSISFSMVGGGVGGGVEVNDFTNPADADEGLRDATCRPPE